jgi:response regulator RpfG family c-di-GMP phosphodiesterase
MGQFHLTALNVAEYDGHRISAMKSLETPLRLLESVDFAPGIKEAVYRMYERHDGRGFPDGLSGKEIVLGARVLALADTYADLTQNSRNPYRRTLSPQEAMEAIAKHRGTVFDPSLVDIFQTIVLGEGLRNKLLANRYDALILDPDSEETTVLELRMVEQAFDVQIVRTIATAKKLLEERGEGGFSVVVSEIELPDGNGLDLLEAARKAPWGKDLPWVVYSSRQHGKEAQRAFHHGATDFVTKPLSSEIFVAKLKAMLDQQSTSRGARGVSGSLSEMGLPDIVQILHHGRKSGKLNVRSAGQSGEIHVQSGSVVHAFLGTLRGTDAFYAMLKFHDGEFALDPSFVPPVRVIEDSSEALLLEGMRRMDEGG